MILNQYNGGDVALRELKFNTSVPLTYGTLITVPGHDLFRLYRYADEFAIVEWISCDGAYGEDFWADPDVMVQPIAYGHFYWREDGIRHIHFGDAGYINYPNISAITAALSAAAAIYDEPGQAPPMSAGTLCERLADVFDCQYDQRRRELARTLREHGEILGTRHTASALRTYWSVGAGLATSQGDTARMATYLELIKEPVEPAISADPVGAMHVIVDLLAFYARRAKPEDITHVALLRHELTEAVARVEHAMIKARAAADR